MGPDRSKWLLVIASFVARTISQGSILCLGVYFDDVRLFLHSYSTPQVAVIFSVAYALVDCAGIIASALLRKIEARYLCIAGSLIAFTGLVLARFAQTYWQLLISFSILNAFGQGIPRALLPIAVSHRFSEKQRHVAVALQNTGDGLGGVLFPLIYSSLIDAFTWRNSLLIVAGIVLHLLPAALIVPGGLFHQSRVNKANDDQAESLVAQIPWFPNLPLLLLNLFIHAIGYTTFLTFIFSDLRLHAVSDSVASAILATIGAVSIVGRLLVALLHNSHRFLPPRWAVYALGHLLRALCVLLFVIAQLVFGSSPTSLITSYFILCALFGLTDGITGALICIVGLDLFGLERLADVYPLCLVALGVGSLVGVPIAGVVKDAVNYDAAFLLSAAAFAVAGLVLVPLCVTRKHYNRRTTSS